MWVERIPSHKPILCQKKKNKNKNKDEMRKDSLHIYLYPKSECLERRTNEAYARTLIWPTNTRL